MNYSIGQIINKLSNLRRSDYTRFALFLKTLPFLDVSRLPVNKSHITVFSFDSFCEPHLVRTVRVIRSLSCNPLITSSLLLSPLCHFILSSPGICDQLDPRSISYQQLETLDLHLISISSGILSSLPRGQVNVLPTIFSEDLYPGSISLFKIIQEFVSLLISDPLRSLFLKTFRSMSLLFETYH